MNRPKLDKNTKFSYSRPEFLQLKTEDEINVSADHQIRPIILPRDCSRLPWRSGYAECINAGKSQRNEDQAVCYRDYLVRKSALLRSKVDPSRPITPKDQLPWYYFGIFDGHAGPSVAVAAAAQLHYIIKEKLSQISDLLVDLELDIAGEEDDQEIEQDPDMTLPSMIDICRQNVTVDSLIMGALESAFCEMDALIEKDKQNYKMPGGCTAIVSLFILGKLYICNAGDSRAIVSKGGEVKRMSLDFTPTTERKRILRLGQQRPELLGTKYTHLQFAKQPTRRDVGKHMLYRDAYMTGWSMKKITYDDLRVPLIWGEGKRSRVLATIGVTRGFGDQELRAAYGSLPIKPFLTAEPEVNILPLEYDDSIDQDDVLIMGSDGLWDVTSNQMAAEIVKKSFDHFSDDEESRTKYRFVTAAQDLVIHSRGSNTGWRSFWRVEDGSLASLDDISVFVIPLKPYKDEYLLWKSSRLG